MNVIPRMVITDAILTSSTVPETVAATYAGGTTYGLGDLAGPASSYGVAQTVYRSLQAGNVGHAQSDAAWWRVAGTVYPVYASGSSCAMGGIVTDLANHNLYESQVAANTGNPLTDVTKWLIVSKTNKWAMFDRLRNTTSSVPKTLTFVLTPGERINSLALMGMVNVEAAAITMTSSGVEVYNRTANLNTREVLDWYSYFFEPFSTRPSLVLFDLPPYTNGIITITLSTTNTDNVELGACVIGSYEFIGLVQFDAESDEINFSTITRDFAGGIAVLTPRLSVPKNAHQIFVEKKYVNRIRALRKSQAGHPAVWAGIDDSTDEYFESILIHGIYKRFSISLRHPTHAVISLEVEEL